MKTMMEKIVDEVLELVSVPFDIDLRNLKYDLSFSWKRSYTSKHYSHLLIFIPSSFRNPKRLILPPKLPNRLKTAPFFSPPSIMIFILTLHISPSFFPKLSIFIFFL